ncbi:ATP-dependent DNA helicase [Fusarium keratoplasticum]|uniref:ATP-dependent DNA helicase n=1 Tax=Fusarium keratoplasticum TaxID=1328300 RepID=A0ACC0QAA2_9HYPO|nr:ATP-dependent DNA helicase [Fusarium keratoplasticum]KAI8648243.1 ATP-dependent DNA helicase [Fusarium keratoplasticum]KAI8648992.1 ATP-dependent DNA helicase [Fusarium keratoplasticum]
MLHHPHRDQNHLKDVEGTTFATFAEAYDLCLEHENLRSNDYYGELPPPVEDEFEEDPHNEDEITGEECNELAQQLPQHGPQTEDIENLGVRDLDLQHDWSSHVGRYPDLYEVGKGILVDRQGTSYLSS